MKFRKKLLSFGAMSVATTTITPICLLTGCSTGLVSTYNLVNNYYPSIERLEEPSGDYTIHDVHDWYIQQLQRNLDTFVQDYFWSKSWDGAAFDQFAFWRKLLFDEIFGHSSLYSPSNAADKIIFGPAKDYYTKDVESISNLKIESMEDVVWNNVTWTIPHLSFTINFQSNVKSILIDLHEIAAIEGVASVAGYITGHISFYNVPFYVIMRTVQTADPEYPVTVRIISFEPFFDVMDGTIGDKRPWLISTNVNSTISGQIRYDAGTDERIACDWLLNKLADNENPQWVYDELSLSQTIGCLFCSSYYLEYLKPKGGQ